MYNELNADAAADAAAEFAALSEEEQDAIIAAEEAEMIRLGIMTPGGYILP